MNKRFTSIFSRGCVAGLLIMLVQTASVRASINLGDGRTDATPNDGLPGQAGLSLPNAGATPGQDNTQTTSADPATTTNAIGGNPQFNPSPAGGERAALNIISGEGSSVATSRGDVSVLDVLNKNIDGQAPKADDQLIDPSKLATSVRPDDAFLGRPKLLTSPGEDTPEETDGGVGTISDVVFAGSRETSR